jgi:HSP20 family protein
MSVRDILPWRQRTRDIEGSDVLDPFSRMHREMDRLFEDMFPASGRLSFSPGFRTKVDLMPSLDVSETDESLEVSADLPGMDTDDVSVTLNDGMLTISGERKEEKEEKEKNYYRSERSYGSFVRRLALPFAVDEDHIQARFDKGVLKIVLPKSPEVKAHERRIEIKTS